MSLADMKVIVTDHAMWRAAERFPWFDTVLIEEEVRDALRAGRASGSKPNGYAVSESSLYVWTEDEKRLYTLRVTGSVFVVTTTLDVLP